MVRKEQVCCAFLTFDVRPAAEEIRVSITAPESSREAADTLFEQFLTGAPAQSACGCAAPSPSNTTRPIAGKQPGEKAAGLTAVTLATGAVACGACCVLPFALPAVAVAGTGSILAFVASAHASVTGLAALAVVGAWGWIVWQSVRARRLPAASTLYMMAVATFLLSVAVLWPLVERRLARVPRA